MSALDRTPVNTGYLQPSKFLLSFSRIPNAQYFCQAVNIPGGSINNATYTTPFKDIPIAGTKPTTNPLNITFAVNGDLQSWMDLYQWMASIASPTGFVQRDRLTQQQSTRTTLQQYSDATLVVLSNLNNPIGSFYFHNAFPVSISDIQFDTKENADAIVTATASFMFEYYEYKPA